MYIALLNHPDRDSYDLVAAGGRLGVPHPRRR